MTSTFSNQKLAQTAPPARESVGGVQVGVYVRISEDLEGLALGVARQEADGRTVASLRRWEVAGVYIDNDETAFGAKRDRPEFERLIADLARGAIDGIIAYDLDRFAREPVDLERAIEVYDRREGLVFATVQGDIDLSTADGLTMARVMVAFANKSSRDTSRRVKRKHLELAQRGVPVGGYRPFGYEPDRLTIRECEAELIRLAAREVISGIGLHTICKRWNKLGITTTAGNPWRKSVLRTMLLSPRMVGYRVYRKQIARNSEGEPIMAQTPLLDLELWEQLTAVICDPARSGPFVHLGRRKYLLTGVVRCAVCSGGMWGNASQGTFYYGCKDNTCGKVGISGPKLDALVEGLVVRYLADREVEHQAEPWPGEAELAAVSVKVTELMNAYTATQLSGDVVFPAVEKLESTKAMLRAERKAWHREQAALSSRPTNVTEEWPDMDTDQKRTVIASVLQAVVVRPSASRGGRFDASRVTAVWRDNEPLQPTAHG